MVKLSDAQLAARYQQRETLTTKQTRWKGCHFCKLPIQPGEQYKKGTGNGYSDACLNCVNKLAPPPIQKPLPVIVQPVVDCSPTAPAWETLLAQSQSNLQSAQDMLAKASEEAAQLRQEKQDLASKFALHEHLIAACLKLVQGERKFNTTAFLSERTEIKRVLVQMNRWTGS